MNEEDVDYIFKCFTVVFIIIGVLGGLWLLVGPAHATWKPQYADSSPAVRDWYETRVVSNQ